MTVTELFADIRSPYAEALARALAQQPAHAEAAYRMADGQLAASGALGLPTRMDLLPLEGEQAGQPASVDSSTRLQFEPLSFALGGTAVTLAPFVWDWMPLVVQGLSAEAAGPVLRDWFLNWFDAEDEEEADAQGLYGVVHYLGDPEAVDQGLQVTADLGSAPVEALEDLLWRLSDAQATAVAVG